MKAGFGIWRLVSGKWLHNLVRDIHGGVVLEPAAVTSSQEALV